jgi:hypothetical protein
MPKIALDPAAANRARQLREATRASREEQAKLRFVGQQTQRHARSRGWLLEIKE